jgi:hypothetical protein
MPTSDTRSGSPTLSNVMALPNVSDGIALRHSWVKEITYYSSMARR